MVNAPVFGRFYLVNSLLVDQDLLDLDGYAWSFFDAKLIWDPSAVRLMSVDSARLVSVKPVMLLVLSNEHLNCAFSSRLASASNISDSGLLLVLISSCLFCQ